MRRVHIWQPAPKIIQYELQGPIDLDLFLETTETEKEVLQKVQSSGGAWASIVIFSGDCRFHDQGVSFAPFFMTQRQNMNVRQVSVGFVIPPGTKNTEAFQSKLQEFYAETNLRLACFRAYSEAKRWTQEQLQA